MSQARTGPVVGVLAGAGIVVSLMQTLVVPLIPDLPNLLHTTAANASWAITATLLAGAVATPVLGRLGDMYGKRRILLASLTMLVIGSLSAVSAARSPRWWSAARSRASAPASSRSASASCATNCRRRSSAPRWR